MLKEGFLKSKDPHGASLVAPTSCLAVLKAGSHLFPEGNTLQENKGFFLVVLELGASPSAGRAGD